MPEGGAQASPRSEKQEEAFNKSTVVWPTEIARAYPAYLTRIGSRQRSTKTAERTPISYPLNPSTAKFPKK